MWDVMLTYETRRRELIRESEYAWMAREASAHSHWDRRARRRASAALRRVAARLAAPPTASAGPRWIPLLDELCR